MRHCATGRHARYRSRNPLLPALLAAIAATVLFLGIGTVTGTFASASAVTPARVLADRGAENPVYVISDSDIRTRLAQVAVQARMTAAAHAAAVLAARTYTVRSGDSISTVAMKRCGTARDWTGIYAASRAHRWTGVNANSLTTGQHLYLSCAYLPSMLRYAPAPPPPAPVRAIATVATARTASTGTGYHRAHAAPVQVPGRSYATSSGTYSYAGLEALWVSAGGPSWAASHAAEIAECESGGRTNAFNPSGATGLWQILGSVVPGNLYNAFTNALNAVAKFKASGDTFAQWVCQ